MEKWVPIEKRSKSEREQINKDNRNIAPAGCSATRIQKDKKKEADKRCCKKNVLER
jgi:hypothetical protein